MHAALQGCADRARHGELTVREVLDELEEGSYVFICILFTLPFLQPISLGPISMIGGFTFAVLGWQWARSHPTPWLPDRVARLPLNGRAWAGLLSVCDKILTRMANWTKPRFPGLVNGSRGDLIAGVLVIIGGVLISAPFPGIPFNNTLPALIILFACVGRLERDGLMTIIAVGWIGASILYFSFLIALFLFAGKHVLDWIPSILR